MNEIIINVRFEIKCQNQFRRKRLVIRALKGMNLVCISILLFLSVTPAMADNGYNLWLKYDKIQDKGYLKNCNEKIESIYIAGHSETILAAKQELSKGLSGLLGHFVPATRQARLISGIVIAGTPSSLSFLPKEDYRRELSEVRKDGYVIKEIHFAEGSCFIIISDDDVGVLYGVFRFLRLLQTYTPLENTDIVSSPKVQWRMLDHWDNLSGSVGRGYAGRSIWKWKELPGKVDRRYKDYARANASVGINGIVLNNVNADPGILTPEYIKKAAALANVFRPYGIHIFFSANFAAPKILGKLKTADPLDPEVKKWWKEKVNEIYQLIPDFGGFLVKANSEGQPGPLNYGRTHAQGANMMADALAPHGGVLIWRAFVYSVKKGVDRAKMAFDAFKPLDGKFRSNVFLQVKNGPIDFQPREPFSPLFGAMPHTNEMVEFQITQEYLGRNKALVYLAPLFKETLESDTYAEGKGSTVARILDGSAQEHEMTGMAGVANIGDDSDWTGYIFGQANWYAFGRLAWNHDLSAKQIAKEWINMTLSHDPKTVKTILDIMLHSRDIFVDYETPLGLNVLAGWNHYDPDPAMREFYHRADSTGLGFDRTMAGSDAVGQYFPPVRDSFNRMAACPEKFLTWFHHVPWSYKMKSGRTFWEELCYKYNSGVKGVEKMQREWATVKGSVDHDIFVQTKELLAGQEKEAKKWRDVCLNYFEKFSRQPIPDFK